MSGPAFWAYLAAVPWLKVVTDSLAEKFDLSAPVGRGEAAAFVVNFLKLVENRVELEAYVQEAAEHLRVSEEAIFAELASQRRHDRRREEFQTTPAPAKTEKKPVKKHSPAMLTLLELAINSFPAAQRIGELLEPDDLELGDPVAEAISRCTFAGTAEEHSEVVRKLGELLETDPSPELSRALVSHTEYADIDRAVMDSMRELRSAKRRALRNELLAKLRDSGDPEERLQLLADIHKLR